MIIGFSYIALTIGALWIGTADAYCQTAWSSVKTSRPQRIVDGTETSEFPAVGVILKGPGGAQQVWCTGTLISENRVLTAAHCVMPELDANSYSVFFQLHGNVGVDRIDWMSDRYDFPHADLAVLTLSTSITEIPPVLVNISDNIPVGTHGIIVGFGRTGGASQGYGIKRMGYVQTSDCPNKGSEDLICWSFQDTGAAGPKGSNTCNGDSGGPLLVSPASAPATLLLAGVTSGGNRADCLPGDFSYDTNLFFYRDYLRSFLTPSKDLDLPTYVAINSDVVPFSAALSIQEKSIQFPPKSSAAVVSFNLEQNESGPQAKVRIASGTDFVLSDDACTFPDGAVTGACSLPAPDDGSVYTIRISRTAGEGLAQITTAFLGKR